MKISSGTPSSLQYPRTPVCQCGRRQGPPFRYSPSSKLQTCISPPGPSSVCVVPRLTVQFTPPTRSRASRMLTLYPSFPSSYPTVIPDTPAPRMITFVPFGLPESTGRGPACAAIKSQERIPLITSVDPPTRPNCSRNVRLVRGSVGSPCDCFTVMTPSIHVTRVRYLL